MTGKAPRRPTASPALGPASRREDPSARGSLIQRLARIEDSVTELNHRALTVEELVTSICAGLVTPRHIEVLHAIVGADVRVCLVLRAAQYRGARQRGERWASPYYPVEVAWAIASYSCDERVPVELLKRFAEYLEAGSLFTPEAVAQRRKNPRPDIYLASLFWVHAELARIQMGTPDAIELRGIVDAWLMDGVIPADVRDLTEDDLDAAHGDISRAEMDALFAALGEDLAHRPFELRIKRRRPDPRDELEWDDEWDDEE